MPEWSYHILQSHIATEQTAYFWVEHCPDAEWNRLLNRNIHHAFQNGARRVWIRDLEGSRLKEGDTYGYYRLGHVPPEGTAPAGLADSGHQIPVPSRPGFRTSAFTREEWAVMAAFDRDMGTEGTFPGPGWFCAYDAGCFLSGTAGQEEVRNGRNPAV